MVSSDKSKFDGVRVWFESDQGFLHPSFPIGADVLTTDTLRLLRLHGFALTFYGGKSLHATEEKTWRSALDGLAASLTLSASGLLN